MVGRVKQHIGTRIAVVCFLQSSPDRLKHGCVRVAPHRLEGAAFERRGNRIGPVAQHDDHSSADVGDCIERSDDKRFFTFVRWPAEKLFRLPHPPAAAGREEKTDRRRLEPIHFFGRTIARAAGESRIGNWVRTWWSY